MFIYNFIIWGAHRIHVRLVNMTNKQIRRRIESISKNILALCEDAHENPATALRLFRELTVQSIRSASTVLWVSDVRCAILDKFADLMSTKILMHATKEKNLEK